jgi:hypothetical protein
MGRVRNASVRALLSAHPIPCMLNVLSRQTTRW